ncbi:MAG: T9SS type A sorting domain-containing protein, partial [Ginsengibacter sp.]
ASTPSASLTLPGGEKLTATSTLSSLKGIHVYVVGAIPNTTAGIPSFGSNDRYFGVFPVGSATPHYSGVYDYTGNPLIGSEIDMRLFKRNANDVTNWTDVTATQNTTDNTFTFEGTFTEYMLGSMSTGGPLPLRFVSFTGSKQISQNLLQWKTGNESNTSFFEVERRTNLLQFSQVGTVTAIGSGNNNYSFIDKNNIEGLHYYRLKIVDKNGSYTYSNILQLDQPDNLQFSVFPNPAKKSVTIAGLSHNGILSLMNAEGKVLQKIKVTSQAIVIDISDYAGGTYLLKYQTGEKVTYQRLIK